MATTNVSDEKQNFSEKVQDLFCQLHKATVIHDQLKFIAVLNALLSVHYDISWKCFGPSCSAQRVFTTSAIQ